MPTLAELSDRFAIDGALAFERGEGGLTRMRVATPACVGEAYLHGAHVTRWRPAGHDEVLWLSARANFLPDTAIRGGVPICFPWFAGHKPKDQPNAPSHGLARTHLWDLDQARLLDDVVELTFTARIAPCWSLRYTVGFGQTLGLRLEATNTGEADAEFELALHSYFNISQITRARVTGLAGETYENTVGGAGTTHTQPDAPLTFAAETDFIFATDRACTIHDPGLARTIHINKAGSASSVVWNPWDAKARAMNDFGDDEWPGMLCVEPANIAPHAVQLAPGATHTTAATLAVTAIG
ncbi:MAG: D-hexose-6-phosphate mutarotase [Phycisphaerales bacterium JB063]